MALKLSFSETLNSTEQIFHGTKKESFQAMTSAVYFYVLSSGQVFVSYCCQKKLNVSLSYFCSTYAVVSSFRERE